ncbi:PBP family phospholipid-binding protein [Luteococcus japonicus]|uniref:PBP family phospholipid-binding protein n=1 Tax=Luteococcus japonicus TaxID=33984 RepID=A0A3N1ZWI1_9ACTN|nr:YbhB/YbcL family Raf kinase inhibitor-like protein [Luteococcus japonicus]ROR55203.1 PBP family phospholipid-binding protein [Luteococcus japonicus]
MELASTSFADGERIDLMYAEEGAGGQNISPALAWTDAPEGTKSFAVTIFDPDAPTGSGWWHWVAVDIPAEVTSLPEGASMPEGVREWVTDHGYAGYGGPCPPPGPAHRYIHTVYALPFEELPVPDDATSAQVRFTILANQLDSASTTGLFALPEQNSQDSPA